MPRIPSWLTITACLALVCGRAGAQTPYRPQCCPPGLPGSTTPLTPPGQSGQPGQGEGAQGGQAEGGQQPAQDSTTPPSTDFGQGAPAGGAETGGFNPAMFGDLLGGPNVHTIVKLPNGATVAAIVPVLGRGSFKIADNESPRPTDRVFFTYNYFDRVNTSFQGSDTPSLNINREVIGFEKTFGPNFSFGMRLPFLQVNGTLNPGQPSQIGDLTFIIKWALLNDRATGNVFSIGMVVTAPTGDPFIAVSGNTVHPTLLQPYLGYIVNSSNLYLQGFSSVTVPTDSADVTLLLTDIAVGYWVYRDPRGRYVHGVVPTLEAHLVTPLDHRGSQHVGGVPDYLSMTTGLNLVFGRASTFGCALGVPVTGPRPYNLEAIAALNFRF